MSGVGGLRPIHRSRRFFASIAPAAPSGEQVEWARSRLEPGEQELFDAMATVDQAHSIGVARAVERHGCDDWMVTAALTHDVGKSVARLGIIGRVVATLARSLGAERFAAPMMRRGGCIGRVGAYLAYPRLGAQMLTDAGADPRVAAWSAEHHEPEERWSIPVEDGRILVAADDGEL